MASIASIAPEYDMGVLEALDALGLDDKFGESERELDSDREKWVREQLNEASGPRSAPVLVVCIGANRSGKTYQGTQWVAEDPQNRMRAELLHNGRDRERLIPWFQKRRSIWLEVVPVEGAAAYLGWITDLAIDRGYTVDVRKLEARDPTAPH